MSNQNANALDNIVRIEVTADPIIPGRSGTNDRGPWVIPSKQTCWLWQGDKYPTRIDLAYPAESGPRRPGFYLLAGSPFKVSASVRPGASTGRVVIDFDERNVDLIPIEEIAALKAAPVTKAA